MHNIYHNTYHAMLCHSFILMHKGRREDYYSKYFLKGFSNYVLLPTSFIDMNFYQQYFSGSTTRLCCRMSEYQSYYDRIDHIASCQILKKSLWLRMKTIKRYRNLYLIVSKSTILHHFIFHFIFFVPLTRQWQKAA